MGVACLGCAGLGWAGLWTEERNESRCCCLRAPAAACQLQLPAKFTMGKGDVGAWFGCRSAGE
ncbi:predicted protein [Plenodomus lingam JN3]|uniref:Predicted protein n=1 Tax=Leptosphaeria maculans (strain JN3 / isolate v23.1.3 / race Av1-4-5-6-7-8) TaxID=985895 RepID=E5ACF8_LEPMJ|nr:predicted protein [Plenodomus lingam JN3]CBY02160.1 predicted protein [Plenodomus lingam JN3]